MKAIVFTGYGSPDVIQFQEVAKPSPKENEILVKVRASSITTADSMIREGKPCFGRLILGFKKHKKPIAGTGFSGEVESIGQAVTGFSKGEMVFGETGLDFSANAEFLCIPESGVISKIGNNMSFETAAPVCDGAVTSYVFLTTIGKLKKGQRILINGASGSLGSAAVQIAKHLGADVTAVCSASNIALVKSLGADKVINYVEEDFTKKGKRYDIIYDTVGKSTFTACKKSLNKEGVYLSPVLSFSLLIQMIWTSKNSRKKAKFCATGLLPPVELKSILNELKAMFANNKLESIIDRKYTLEDAVMAHRYVDTGHKKGNVIIVL